MGRHFFSYHFDGDEGLKVDLSDMDDGLYSLDFLNLRIGLVTDLNSLHELISKAEALIEIEQMRLKEKTRVELPDMSEEKTFKTKGTH